MRVKACFKCQLYVPIIENNYLNNQEINAFEKLHSGHPVQVVNKEEIPNYKRWTGTSSSEEKTP
jgi:hypothetical protein